MSIHQTMKNMKPASVDKGLVLHLGGLDYAATKVEVEQMLKEKGFENITIYWPFQATPNRSEHRGWCGVQLADKDTAQRAQEALQGARLKTRRIKVGLMTDRTAASRVPAAPSKPPGSPKTKPPAPAQIPTPTPTVPPLPTNTAEAKVTSSSSAPPTDPARIPTPKPPSPPLPPLPTDSAEAEITSSSSAPPPGTHSTSSILPPCPKPPQLAQAKRIPRSLDPKPRVHRASDALAFEEYPSSWEYKAGNHNADISSFLTHAENLVTACQQDGVRIRFGFLTIPDGDKRVRSQAIYSPATQNAKSVESVFIHVQKPVGDKTLYKCINLERLSEYEAVGWSEWHHPGRPIPKGDGLDHRQIMIIEDVWSYDAPYKDTARMFPTGIKTSRQCDGLDWHPGQLIGDDPEAKAQISHCPEVLIPGRLENDFLSATSGGHTLRWLRPGRIGVGWGDHDLYREWQLNGRHVRVDMVEQKEWIELPTESIVRGITMEFEPPEGAPPGTKKMVVKFPLAPFSRCVQPNPPATLWRKLHEKDDEAKKKSKGWRDAQKKERALNRRGLSSAW